MVCRSRVQPSLFGEERRPETKERWKSSLQCCLQNNLCLIITTNYIKLYVCMYCNETDRLIARAKVRVLKYITVVFECNARTSSKTKRQLYGE